MAEQDNIMDHNEEEKEIDLLELAAKLWNQRKKLIKWSICGVVAGLIVAFSIPKEYSTSVKLAPEANDSKSVSGGLGALASMAGLGSSGGGADALYPMLYPDVVSSVPFVTSLFNVEVPTMEDGKKITVRQYLEEDIRSPWWGYIMRLPGALIGLIKGSGNEEEEGHKLDNFKLTQRESSLVDAMNKRVGASVDAKTSVVTIDVSMQDPLVSAVLADTVVSRLQQYITAYRTNKARQDLEYAVKLNDEAKQTYYDAQQKLAEYQDRNQGIAFNSAKTTLARLENEAQLAFSLYNQTAQQVQKAQAKVQETTPVYAIVTPATVPVKPASPRKAMILIGFTFLAFVACAAKILFLDPMIASGAASIFKKATAEDGASEEK